MLHLSLLLMLAAPSANADDAIKHSVLIAAKGRVAIVNEKGEIEWETPTRFDGHDLAMLPDGNILMSVGPATIIEMNRDKKIVWKYEAKPKKDYKGNVEVHAFQRLEDGTTMVAETGNKRIVEVDKSGKIVREVPLTIGKPEPHRDTRMVRKLDNGHYLVCQEGDGKVCEYDAKGKVVWSYTLDLDGRPRTGGHDGHGNEVYGAIRLKNGNTLIATGNGNRVIEVNAIGEVVWSIKQDELPGIKLYWVTTLQLLPNGNLIVGNCHAGQDNPQLFEVTRDKKVVWMFKDFKTAGNDMAVAQVLGVKGKVIR